MAWKKYTLAFELCSPLHIGYRKTGNLMQTRGYVPGKVVWAALTARLTRDSGKPVNGERYQEVGDLVREHFRCCYLYPALPKTEVKTVGSLDDLNGYYPWDDDFGYRFLSSYASTALSYPNQSAAEGLLHEVEFIRPQSRPIPSDSDPKPVYLAGSLYVREALDPKLDGWKAALSRVQFGGERGYGWGRVRLLSALSFSSERIMQTDEPTISLGKDKRVKAHVVASDRRRISGPIEPFLGWKQNKDNKWGLSEAEICYVPGAILKEDGDFTIKPYGIWNC